MTITDFSALTMRLPALDTATLSQAWRDALHHAGVPQAKPAHVAPACERRSGWTRTCTRMNRASAPSTHVAPAANGLRAERPANARGVERIEPRVRTASVAGRIEPAGSRQMPRRDQHVITLPGGERICLVISTMPESTHITLLCAPHLQQAMRAALRDTARNLARHAVALSVAPLKVTR